MPVIWTDDDDRIRVRVKLGVPQITSDTRLWYHRRCLPDMVAREPRWVSWLHLIILAGACLFWWGIVGWLIWKVLT